MTYSDPISQWDSLLTNLGVWQGSFSRFSPKGLLQDETSSQVTLEGLSNNRTIRQTIQQVSSQTGEILSNKVLEYSTLGRSILLFETGEFSQGSLQFSPFSEFGAELGFMQGDRRLRLVQLFDKGSQLSSLTLVREHRQDSLRAERPPLTLDQLVGTWYGEAVTIYPDWRSPDRYATTLSIQKEGDRLVQQLTAPEVSLTSTAAIEGCILRFEQGQYPIQVVLLPDGASSNTPIQIPKGQPFFLEAGWLIAAGLRQRMIRRYDAQGAWVSLTLVTERRSQ
ncbi:MAG: DUF3598 family protein [Drouetiella hepatica Uher 2000/2452]|jgi:hypothetical protein|uniref:DUF3598 family protein n=1 Tax=Drouetiella hepatica Uher 2000/2452 TaxID=904376 RepID=A0A951Q9E8_9CYAN|nr:DUF3598 family protein [Drouetiella hepatica Uher 2000/2452]